jgi:lipopolysaccharide export system protein LptA
MKFLSSLSLIVFQLALSGAAFAEKADSTKPMNIEADQMVYDEAKQVNTFAGRVVLTRGTLKMQADKLIVSTDADGYQSATLHAAPNSLATFRQKRDGGPNLWVDGHAKRIEYDGRTEVVKLFADAELRRLEGTRPTDEVNGEFISYDSRAELYTVNNTVSGESKPGAGRVRVTIQPRTEAQGQ